MKKQFGFYFDSERCVQCHACEVACKSANNIDLGLKWRTVENIWNGAYPEITNKSISFSCIHCAEPACVEACPTGAVKKREQDGIILVDREKCIGCHCCLLACPFGIPQFGRDGRMQKCNYVSAGWSREKNRPVPRPVLPKHSSSVMFMSLRKRYLQNQQKKSLPLFSKFKHPMDFHIQTPYNHQIIYALIIKRDL
jgi:Fe-S-cluster-containing dehydrogenase component